MDFGIPQKINTFDDGNQIYKYMPNAWIIIGSQFNGQKVKLKNKDFIKQFPLGLNLDEFETEEEKIIEIAKALGQYDSEGNLIIYRELEEGEEIPEGQTIIFDPELIENQQNLTQIGIESEFQYIFKPCQDKAEYNRSIKLLDTSGMVSLEEATRRYKNRRS